MFAVENAQKNLIRMVVMIKITSGEQEIKWKHTVWITLCCDKVGKRFSNYNLSCFTIFHQFNEYSKMNFCDNLEELIDVNYYTKKEKVLTSGVENNLLNEPVYKKRKKICPSTVTTRSQTRSTNIY